MQRTISLLLCAVMCVAPILSAEAQETMQSKAEKFAAGHQRVDVTLADGAQLTGRVSSASAESFVVAEEKTGTHKTIAYSGVSRLKKHGMSKGAKIGIGVGVAAAVVFVAVGLAVRGLGQSIH